VSDDNLFAGMSLEIDPEMPPGTFDLRSGGHRLRSVLPGPAQSGWNAMRRRAEGDPGFAAELEEELASLAESRDLITYPGEMTAPEECEGCGTPVTVVPERPAGAPRDSDLDLARWETVQWRKHTPRRCQATRKEPGR
jgi:hypothetical protein